MPLSRFRFSTRSVVPVSESFDRDIESALTGQFYQQTFGKGAMSTGAFGTPEGRCDISYRDVMGQPRFSKHVGGDNGGFFDAGKVTFESVTEADAEESKYFVVPATSLPANLDHVYVMKTLEGKYAKFIVRKFVK